ncbi:cyclopropane-fatty-acyl-phospholipid synthase [Cognatishimia sp. SS12]|uniref:SAM-dependent methyltransferase n=1 Tax=Cognatishimia sp. SS12 TaxID=2979465 RepID=UPI00232AE506|nr:cyclopropane-fatty-acyl-phospholipid synthase family protein [Cognatishimia sp. SS12]MDC0738170.1 cyclopropane-fatty-acyl-phospholipid synthase [Cognatishimia sp. SS12]
MWTGLFLRMMQRMIKRGALTLTMPDGQVHSFGNGRQHVAVTLHDPSLPRRIVLNPELAVGEGYTDGTLTIENDDLYGFLTLGIRNFSLGEGHGAERYIAPLLKRFQQFNPMGRAKDNVAHHYDLSGALYDLFLDADKQYSCAYFPRPDMTLEEAQAAKKAHIARKLRLEPDMHVLDIGCGWGGMALTLAQDFGVRVTGVTLSEEQHAVASARVRDAGLEGRVSIELKDYRTLNTRFDRIVSVGMFEHVGVPHYREYFDHVRTMLGADGVALIHTIGRAAPPSRTSPWINKYIFPGGYVPAMSECLKAIEKERLWVTDVEVWRLHYAETLKHWHDRFVAHIDEAEALYDARFCRMWRFYLVASELTFRLHRQCVFQFQLARQQDGVPLTRDYLYRDSADPQQQAAQ